MQKVYLLSGCPAPNTELEYYSQMNIVAPALLGGNYYRFRERYFVPYGYGGYQWKFNEERRDEFARRLSQRSVFFEKKQCFDLPPKTYMIHEVELSRDAMKYYKDMEKKQVLLYGDTVTLAPNKLTQLMKLRQITSGFMLDEEGEGLHLHDDKIHALEEVLEGIGTNQAIIWCNFKNEIHAIEDMLVKSGKTVVTAYSETKSVDTSIKEFAEGRAQFIVAHPKTLKYGVTFVNCTYAIYYSLSYSLDDYVQSHDRIYRYGQKKPCTFIFLVAQGTIDGVIYDVIQNKADMVEVIKRMVEGVR
jgi:SNF2 family DNA or RNA helicase